MADRKEAVESAWAWQDPQGYPVALKVQEQGSKNTGALGA